MNVEKMPIEAKDGDHDSPSPEYASSHLTVDPAAEAKLLRKLDCWLAPMMIVAFLVAYLDRSNIGRFSVRRHFESLSLTSRNSGNAAIAGMNEDLNLTGNRLNVAVTVFYGK